MSAFDRDAFERTLDRVGELLGELWAVDDVLARTEAIDETSVYFRERDEDGNTPGRRGIVVGETHPFDLASYDGISWRSTYLQGLAWGRDVADGVRSLAWELVRTPADEFTAAVDAVRAGVGDELAVLPDDFALLDNNLAAWNGQAADSFGDWYAQVEVIARRQRFVSERMCTLIAASKAVVDLGQNSLTNLVNEVERVLDEQLLLRRPDNGSGTSISFALVVGAALLGILAAIPTGGSSVAVTAGVLTATAAVTSELLQVAAAGVPADQGTEEFQIEVSTAEDALASLSEGVTTILENVRAQWQGVEARAAAFHSDVAAAASAGLLAPRRPSLVGGVTPGGFHHETADH